MTMEESLVNVEFLKSSNNFIARIQSELGGMREYRTSSFEEVLEQVVIDLQEAFDSYGSRALPCRLPFLGERSHALLLLFGRTADPETSGPQIESCGSWH